jgi:hypothetical protein
VNGAAVASQPTAPEFELFMEISESDEENL